VVRKFDMRYTYSILFSILFMCFAFSAKAGCGPRPDSVSVYVFLSEECIISQYFTKQLNELHEEFAGDNLNFVGLFPNPSSQPKKMDAFRQKYGLDFPLKVDVLQRKMDAFEVKVTPEVVVYNHSEKEVLYQGRIDNTFFRVGKRRRVTTTSELRDALQNFTEGKEVEVNQTVAVGCVITALGNEMKNVPMCNDPVGEEQ